MIGCADDSPYAEAKLATIFSCHRAPISGHVVHVVRSVRANDVDELVRINLVVHNSPMGGADGFARAPAADGDRLRRSGVCDSGQ